MGNAEVVLARHACIFSSCLMIYPGMEVYRVQTVVMTH